MGQLAQPFPAYLAQLPLGVTLPPLDPPSLNSIALKSLWAGIQLLAAHRRSCGQPSSHQTSRRDTAGRTKKIGHDGETKSDGHRVRRTHHPQVADRRVDIGFENVQKFSTYWGKIMTMKDLKCPTHVQLDTRVRQTRWRDCRDLRQEMSTGLAPGASETTSEPRVPPE